MNAAKLATWSHRWFTWAWRLTILLLPWQTRWFQEGIALGGYPWEGGRWSIYVSWLPLIATVILGYRRGGIYAAQSDRRSDGRYKYRPYMLATIILLSIAASTYRPATIQWWLEVLLLGSFVYTLIRQNVSSSDLSRWIVYAILPHALLGLWQFSAQLVAGTKWLGIASQNPLTPGVSVIQVEGQRWLRAYGGFPHPNILGGWLILGLGLLVGAQGLRPAPEIRRGWVDAVHPYIIIFSICLALTFSRSAWLGLLIIICLTGWNTYRSEATSRRRMFTIITLIVVSMSATLIWNHALLTARSTGESHLEQRSINERTLSLKNGLTLFRRHPWLGTGPRATNYALVQEGITRANTIPIPPHNVFLLILDEVGLIGLAFLLFVLLSLFPIPDSRFSILAPFLPILLLDHYPWSTWSGLALMALIITLSSLDLSSERHAPLVIPTEASKK